MKTKYKIYRHLAMFVLVNLMIEIFAPSVMYALTGGPSQPEVQSFEPIGTTEMVDLFTGDFTYNIPLFELPGPNGGYPFNLAYHSGISMDQEASWVGLGWNLNPGVINRQMRGLPDDFNGDEIIKNQDMRGNVTFGLEGTADIEIFGADNSIGKHGNGTVGVGLGIYYNNYRGVGYRISPSFGAHIGVGGGLTAGIGLNASLDSQEGVGFSPSLSIKKQWDDVIAGANLGVGYSSRRGLTDLFIGSNLGGEVVGLRRRGRSELVNGETGSRGGTSTLSFANTAYTPSVSQEMQGRSLSVQYKTGIDIWGTYGSAGLRGYFNTQYLKDKGKDVKHKGYGYLNYQNSGEKDLTDFNREKDGMVRKEMPNLAAPNLTYDIYSVAGHGTGGMYRPFRSDVGIIHDQKMKSRIGGGAIGLESGIGPSAHIGVNASVNYSETKSGKWTDDNDLNSTYAFREGIDNNLFEPYVFKTYGEHTSKASNYLDNIGGEEAVAIKLANKHEAKNALTDKYGTDLGLTLSTADGVKDERPESGLVVQSYTNKQIQSGFLNEFNIEYKSVSSNYQSSGTNYDRSSKSEDHIGGITVLNPNGLRYVYGLPAYNKENSEYLFSVDQAQANLCTGKVASNFASGSNYKVTNTDKFYSKTTIPEYAHSYLLTSIVGPDYVDSDGIPGPSKGDLGYWVKINYAKASNAYHWRVPYEKANYAPGSGASIQDDKGSFMYGEKELWYVKSAETRTHIAIFELSKRKDGKGASTVFNDNLSALTQSGTDGSQYKLDKISLYTRAEYESSGTSSRSIKQVHFKYDYSLCQNVPNNNDSQSLTSSELANQGGKLTLKKVYFTYGNSNRGRLSPYEFDYSEGETDYNPDYDMYAVDRWGNYNPGSACQNSRFPYVDQGKTKADLDREASVWHLREIKLPSGGKIDVDYEADDYAYVQNKETMEMFEIVSIADGTTQNENIPHTNNPNDAQRRIYFKLREPISTSMTNPEDIIEEQYIGDMTQLYFNIHAYLRKSTETAFKDYVSGYLDIESWGVAHSNGSEYEWGYIQVPQGQLANGTSKFHPFSLAIWQHLRINNPDLMGIGVSFDDQETLSDAQKAAKVKSLLSILTSIKQVFKGVFDFAFSKDWGERLVLGDPDDDADIKESFIRLKNPVKRKYGGGVRVKSIKINDNWSNMTSSNESDSEYGQVYSYNMEDGTSSGVAAYEPMIGGDENPFREAKKYPETTRLKTANNLYFEGPINEQFFPAPIVGYRRVEVKSLALDRLQKNPSLAGIGTTGSTVNEFYTAKDYPVITDETQLKSSQTNGTMNTSNTIVPIPLLGLISRHKLTASQGYVIKLNDMHGKPRSVTSYAHDKLGNRANLISSVEYFYRDKEGIVGGKQIRELDNLVDVVTDENSINNTTTEQRIMGVDYDFFTDMRESKAVSVNGGVNINNEILFIGPVLIPAFVPWPNIGESEDRTRLAVTNKIIHKSGILEKVVANNEGSVVSTENLLYDALTGRPLLTRVNNNYDDPIYNYNIPAHDIYEGMGGAYANIGMSFDLGVGLTNSNGVFSITSTKLSTAVSDKLIPGDEFIVSDQTGTYVQKVVYAGKNIDSSVDEFLFYSDDKTTSISANSNFFLTRSGARNHLSVDASSITALSDPTQNRLENQTCSYDEDMYAETGNYKREINPVLVNNVFPTINLLFTNRNEAIDYDHGPAEYGNVYDKFTNDVHNYSTLIRVNNDNSLTDCDASFTGGQFDIVARYREAGENYQWTNPFDEITLIWANDNISSSNYGIIAVESQYRNCRNIAEYHLMFFTLDAALSKNYVDLKEVASLGTPELIHDLSDPLLQFNIVKADGSPCPDPYNTTDMYGIIIPIEMKNGDVITAYVETDNCDQFSHLLKAKTPPDYNKPIPGPITASLSNAYAEIDNVLNISAQTFSDGWTQNFVENQSQTEELKDKDMYNSGQKGIWRPKETYAYVTDRAQGAPLNTQSNGTFDHVAMFNYDALEFNKCVPQWRKVNEVTRYSVYGDEVENRDILGRYSSAIYGVGGDYVSALAQNTSYEELGYEGFESFNSGVLESNGNLNFEPYPGTTKLVRAEVIMAKNNIAIVDIPYKEGLDIGSVYLAGAFQDSRSSEEIGLQIDVVDVSIYPDDPEKSVITFDTDEQILGIWKGNLVYETDLVNGTGTGLSINDIYAGTIVNNKAHTGKRSFKVAPFGARYILNSMKFEKGKKYVVSCWISKDDENTYSFTTANRLAILHLTGNALKLRQTVMNPSGEIIEGWQKMEGTFTIEDEEDAIAIWFMPYLNSNGTYIDDIRIFPANGNIETYTYDSKTNNLTDVLDNNNYASHYGYDEQGNLTVIKKETEKGMVTVQESRTHIAE